VYQENGTQIFKKDHLICTMLRITSEIKKSQLKYEIKFDLYHKLHSK